MRIPGLLIVLFGNLSLSQAWTSPRVLRVAPSSRKATPLPSFWVADESPRESDDRRLRWSRPTRLPRKPWLLVVAVVVASLLWPSRVAAEALLQPTYSTNPPLVMHTIGSPISRKNELTLSFRLLFASIVGAAVGKERSTAPHSAAGVRTMALVSLGAAAFTICSMYGFTLVGRYDPSRMASNVASGVGFVGAGVITTTSSKLNRGDWPESRVHGLTTAAAIWLSAAMGVASGVGMYVVSSVAAICTITILRVNRFADRIADEKQRLKLRRRKRRKQLQKATMRTDEELELEELTEQALHSIPIEKPRRKSETYDEHVSSDEFGILMSLDRRKSTEESEKYLE